ncbi:MAG: hypothetical protein R2712_20680 [Vicinamibacterales bacterium]
MASASCAIFYGTVSGLSAPSSVSTWPSDTASLPWPAWLDPAGGRPRFEGALGGILDAGRFRWTLVEVPDARRLGTAAFQDAAAHAYRRVHLQLDGSEHRHPVRYWSFIPGIHDDMGSGLDRYMVFNAGRFSAFAERLGSAEAAGPGSPTASGIGNEGDSLIVACLSSCVPGRPVENPRQVSAYRYSARYGPKPPCFARATVLDGAGASILLVGGTASITGEESRHADDLDAQIDETLRNLGAVVDAAGAGGSLESYRFLRVFLPAITDTGRVRSKLAALLPAGVAVEWRRAELCRAELLLEIEGLAVLPDPRA